MKITTRSTILAVAVLLSTTTQAHDKTAPLDSDQKIFLTQYELARAALAVNDLTRAKKATEVVAALTVIHHESSGIDAPPGFVQDARKLVVAKTISEAREIFKSYSRRAVNVADLKSGYFVVHCSVEPNHEHDWVQATSIIGNPYLGNGVPICVTPKE